MVHKLHGSLTFLGLLLASSLPLFAQMSSLEVKVEKKTIYLPAGSGQEPWNVTRHSIPLKDIQSGGPPRDGIPALSFPGFVSAGQADRLLKPTDIVIGVTVDGEAKAYPIRILNWHEVVNDDIGGRPVLVSW